MPFLKVSAADGENASMGLEEMLSRACIQTFSSRTYLLRTILQEAGMAGLLNQGLRSSYASLCRQSSSCPFPHNLCFPGSHVRFKYITPPSGNKSRLILGQLCPAKANLLPSIVNRFPLCSEFKIQMQKQLFQHLSEKTDKG